jgi:transglutaminase-like putative cysteine protease
MEVPPEASYPPATVPPIAKLVQTVYVETAQPNTVFGAGEISRVYFPSAGLRATRNGSVRSPLLLEEGMVYSVVSDVPVVSDALLRQLPWAKPKGMDPYLQVPADMPARVGALAARITAGTPTQVEAVEAVQSWLRRQTTYDLEVAREPAGAEPLDHFLFETRTGFCEHIASAMAILLREVGIPTRLVTGYGPGTRNPFTGYQEVRQADAHAWVEVYYPVVGWLPYDPTFGVPASDPGLSSRFMAGPVFAAVGRFVRDVVPEPVKAAAGAAGRGVLRAATTVLDTWPLLVGIVAVLAAAGAMLVRRRGRARAGPPPTGAAAAFVDLTAALTDRGHPWAPQQTASEYLAEVLADAALADEIGSAAELVVRTFERERYAMPKPAEAEVIRARAAAARVHDLVG